MEYDNNHFIIASRAYSLHLHPAAGLEELLDGLAENLPIMETSPAPHGVHVSPLSSLCISERMPLLCEESAPCPPL
jgi:hypothetical protein